MNIQPRTNNSISITTICYSSNSYLMKKEKKIRYHAIQRRLSHTNFRIISQPKSEKKTTPLPNPQLELQPPHFKIKHNNYINFSVDVHTLKGNLKSQSLSKKIISKKLLKVKKSEEKNEEFSMLKILLKQSNKIRQVFWSDANYQLSPLILSADFICDQDSFWAQSKQSSILNSMAKVWKYLHKHHFVIWITKSQKAIHRIVEYVKSNLLPLHAIYYVKNRRKYTIDCTPLQSQMKKHLKDYDFAIFLQILKINTKDLCVYESFIGKVPLFSEKTKVCYVRMEESQPGLDVVFQILHHIQKEKSSHLLNLGSLHHFIEKYTLQLCQNLKYQKAVKQKQNTLDEQYVFQIDERIDSYRQSLINYVVSIKGRDYQFEGVSIHYFIGDIIKRNYDKLSDLIMWKRGREQKERREVNLRQDLNLLNMIFYQYI